MPDGRQKPSFWKTLPGIITAIATLVGAVAALITALYGAKIIGHDELAKATAKHVQKKPPVVAQTEKRGRDDNIHLDGSARQERSESTVALDQEWNTLDKPGMISAEAAVPLANIARAWQQEGRIDEALAMARLAYLYGPEIDKAMHLSLLAELLEVNGRTQDAANARAALEKMRQKGEGE
jgi:hypothetical protein